MITAGVRKIVNMNNLIKLKHKLICFLLRNRRVNFTEIEDMKEWALELYSDKDYYLFHDDVPRRGFDFYQEHACYIMGHGYVPITIKHYYELKEKYDYFEETGKVVT